MGPALLATGWRLAKDAYGRRVIIFRQVERICYTDRGCYHCTKLFIDGMAVSCE